VHYASIATGEMKLRPPFVVEIGAIGLLTKPRFSAIRPFE
jgi:hypothetical protein